MSSSAQACWVLSTPRGPRATALSHCTAGLFLSFPGAASPTLPGVEAGAALTLVLEFHSRGWGAIPSTPCCGLRWAQGHQGGLATAQSSLPCAQQGCACWSSSLWLCAPCPPGSISFSCLRSPWAFPMPVCSLHSHSITFVHFIVLEVSLRCSHSCYKF